jgi:hypothetical protein
LPTVASGGSDGGGSVVGGAGSEPGQTPLRGFSTEKRCVIDAWFARSSATRAVSSYTPFGIDVVS